MAKLAILGHATRGKEIIEILEMLGAKNANYCYGGFINRIYFINKNGYIEACDNMHHLDYLQLTLEEFLEKFPYKVGDKVSSKYLKNYEVSKMEWKSANNRVIYKLQGMGWYSADELQPYKEPMESKPNLLQQLKDYFDNTPRDVLEKEWHEYDKYNEISPTVNEYLEYVNKIRQPQYPKNYEECCEVIGYESDRQSVTGYLADLIEKFQQLLICRYAYWKIVGEQIGLGKPWEPDWLDTNTQKYCIYYVGNEIKKQPMMEVHHLLAFPTAEMRNTFYDNFKNLIKQCKEFL